MIKEKGVIGFIKEKYPSMLEYSSRPVPRIRFFSKEAYDNFISKFKEFKI